MTDGAAALVAQADGAAARQDWRRAEALLREAAETLPGDATIVLRLAAICRAAGRPRFALDAIHRALALAPLDFTALLMKASLLDQMGDPAAGEAWGHAIAQKPDGPLPPQMEAALDQGREQHRLWLAKRSALWAEAMRDAEGAADEDERRRLARFRTNALRTTRIYHSEPTDFHYPELTEREFHPRSAFPWLAELERLTDVIGQECRAVMAAERAECLPYIRYADHQPLAQWKGLNHNPDWSAIHLLRGGERVEANAIHCPRTLQFLEGVDQPRITGASPNAMFSLLQPGTHIPPHVGINNTRLVCHLPLIVPEGCWFRVGNQTRPWRVGEGFIFDDTIEHEAMNPTEALRIVLIFDLWHPDLSAVEREGVAALVGT